MSAPAAVLQEDALAVVLFLCWRAKVRPPRVAWSRRNVRGMQRTSYTPKGHRRAMIALGPVMRNGGTIAATLHEVAHHVLSMRAPRLTARERQAWRFGVNRGLKGRRVLHGPAFVETLTELARAWYGDAALYPWEAEYRSLRAAGRGRE